MTHIINQHGIKYDVVELAEAYDVARHLEAGYTLLTTVQGVHNPIYVMQRHYTESGGIKAVASEDNDTGYFLFIVHDFGNEWVYTNHNEAVKKANVIQDVADLLKDAEGISNGQVMWGKARLKLGGSVRELWVTHNSDFDEDGDIGVTTNQLVHHLIDAVDVYRRVHVEPALRIWFMNMANKGYGIRVVWNDGTSSTYIQRGGITEQTDYNGDTVKHEHFPVIRDYDYIQITGVGNA